ncbi:hypothetical protein L211DRAFT_641370 [Terfezia boudieri ATCC MYA-4762]|uniref:Glucose-methanol-choline oxidoreductase N-terminal domain-containing protein n=1 Tax=Terfezia boudieri ATCC MYA-4762 TaxID=1051890 RepID=A0A3N4L8P1_9PEZI|nr:hypothetical protein L211DRAFT_641370 [Terfezia boudieri ATCC MYA-4762]
MDGNWSVSLRTPGAVRREWASFDIENGGGGVGWFQSSEFSEALERVERRMGVSSANLVHDTPNRIMLEACEVLGYNIEEMLVNMGGHRHRSSSPPARYTSPRSSPARNKPTLKSARACAFTQQSFSLASSPHAPPRPNPPAPRPRNLRGHHCNQNLSPAPFNSYGSRIEARYMFPLIRLAQLP